MCRIDKHLFKTEEGETIWELDTGMIKTMTMTMIRNTKTITNSR